MDLDLFEHHQLIMIKADDLRTLAFELFELYKEELEQKVVEQNNDGILTAEEVMDILSCSRATLWRWHQTEYLKHIKVGKKCMYHKKDVYEIKNGQR